MGLLTYAHHCGIKRWHGAAAIAQSGLRLHLPQEDQRQRWQEHVWSAGRPRRTTVSPATKTHAMSACGMSMCAVPMPYGSRQASWWSQRLPSHSCVVQGLLASGMQSDCKPKPELPLGMIWCWILVGFTSISFWGRGEMPTRLVRCAEEEDTPQSASSSRLASDRPTACNALDFVAATHVDRWRRNHSMNEEADFAGAFTSYEEAMAAGGHALAEAWLHARLRVNDLRDRLRMSVSLRNNAQKRKQESATAPAVRSMPDSIGGKLTTAYMRNGTALCGAYQIGLCSDDLPHCQGAHKCAIALRTGRACGGRHPAMACYDKRFVPDAAEGSDPLTAEARRKRPRSQETEDQVQPEHQSSSWRTGRVAADATEDIVVPIVEKNKEPESKAMPRPSKSTRTPAVPAPPLVVIEDDTRAEEHFDRLATVGGKIAQPPTKAFENEAGGAVWLAGLPRADTLHQYPSPVALQVICFKQKPRERGGVNLPGALLMHVEPAAARCRETQWRTAWPTLKNTVLQGETAVIHCMAGRHRAAGIATLARSVLTGETFEESAKWIGRRRNIDLQGLFRDYRVREFLYSMKSTSRMTAALPRVTGYAATERSKVHLVTRECTPLSSFTFAEDNVAEPLTEAFYTEDDQEARSWNRSLCDACVGRAPASVQKRVQD